MEWLNDYIVAVVLGICLCVGYILKKLVPGKAVNRFIPLVVGVLGTLINVWANGWLFTPGVVLGGLTSGLASTGMHEMLHNFIHAEKEE